MKAHFCRFAWKSSVDPYFHVHLVLHFCSKDEDTTQNSQRWILHLDTKSFAVWRTAQGLRNQHWIIMGKILPRKGRSIWRRVNQFLAIFSADTKKQTRYGWTSVAKKTSPTCQHAALSAKAYRSSGQNLSKRILVLWHCQFDPAVLVKTLQAPLQRTSWAKIKGAILLVGMAENAFCKTTSTAQVEGLCKTSIKADGCSCVFHLAQR